MTYCQTDAFAFHFYNKSSAPRQSALSAMMTVPAVAQSSFEFKTAALEHLCVLSKGEEQISERSQRLKEKAGYC